MTRFSGDRGRKLVLGTLVLFAFTLRCEMAAADSRSTSGISERHAAEIGHWRVTDQGVAHHGIRVLDGADGATVRVEQGDTACLTNRPNATPPSQYFYFAVNARADSTSGSPVYLVVDYFDTTPGAVITAEYDSARGATLRDKYWPSDQQWGEIMTGSNTWKTVVFEFDKPAFSKRENLGADFRLGGTVLCVRAVSLTRVKPANCEQLAKASLEGIKKRVTIGPGGQLIIGGFDPAKKEDAIPMTRALEKAIPGMLALGVTSHEGYVRWNLCEPEKGHYDWSVYDRYVALYKKYGLKWVPFLIAGSAYSLPDWYYKKPGSQGYVCLEHGKESDVQSLWNPVLRKYVAQFIKAFCDHYRSSGVIESILLGVTGNYGEAIYPVTGNDWTADIHGPYHTHPGYWAGDPYAVKSFRAWLRKKYKTAGAVSKAWGKKIPRIADIKPFLQKDAPNDRAWLDFCDWYIGSMTDWAKFWLTETRKDFPKGDIYLCTGGDASPEHGSDFGEQCKAAASVGAGVRITNEGSDYKTNFSLTRWVASAGAQYGAYFSFEPAGEVKPDAVVVRIYNATASGARGLHYYYPNIFGNRAATENFVRWGSQFQQRTPLVEIYIYYPETYIRLKGNHFLKYVRPLRDRFDFDYLSDGQIRDGGLKRAKALILLDGNIAEASTWQAIEDWVRAGGFLLYADGIGRLRTVEGNDHVQDVLLGAHADHGRGHVAIFAGKNTGAKYRDFLTKELRDAKELSPATRAMVAADGVEDGVFVSVCPAGTLFWLNTTDQDVTRRGITIPAHGIASCPAVPK